MNLRPINQKSTKNIVKIFISVLCKNNFYSPFAKFIEEILALKC